MNFIEEYKKGKAGNNFGLPTGLPALDRAIDGIQRKSIYAVAASPKVGKTSFVDFSFVIQPFLFYQQYITEHPDSHLRIQWVYYSYEIDRVKKQYKYAAYFIAKDYGVRNFMYKERAYDMSPRYLLHRLKDQDNLLVPVTEAHEKMLQEVYTKYIIPMFGEYDKNGRQVSEGVIKFVEDRNNPTGLRNELLHYAKQNGVFIEEKFKSREKGTDGQEKITERSRVAGYTPNNEELYTIIVTDHMRKLNRERGFTIKENIDKWVEYQVELRNWCSFTFVDIIHLNRNMANIDRIKYLKENLYPTGEDIKDTGNLSEEADYVLTMFNPQDEKYNMTMHFGILLENYPNYRSIHLVESRDTDCPQHLPVQMFGNINNFKQI